jgi:hypothetical protein
MKATFTQKNHGSVHMPKHGTLSEAMMQGGGYAQGAPPHGLSRQMMQGEGYDHPIKTSADGGKVGTKLQELMNQ